MGVTDADPESSPLISTPTNCSTKVPKDKFHLAYIMYFTLGTGYLLPWNAFITAVDYFSYLYPEASVDRVFSVVYMILNLSFLLLIVLFSHRSNPFVRINVGLVLFVLALTAVPVMDVVWIEGRVGIYSGFYATVAAVAVSGVADALVQGGVIGSAGELPERYMQAVVAGTAASGVLVSFMRIFTKAVYPQDAYGLRQSANLYFIVSIIGVIICIFFHNMAHNLPVISYHNELKNQAITEENEEKGALTGALWRSTLAEIVGRIKWYGFAVSIIYVVTLAIFPGYITEDVHSLLLKDWYPILLITSYNVFDLVGKSLTAVYLFDKANSAIGLSFGRLLFLPLFWGCLHGPEFFRTEIPVTLLTCLLGLTNGYLTSVLFIMAPKIVQLQHSGTAGVVIVLFLVVGMAIGSVVAWFWVI